jgi:hypothetical protein
MPAGKPPLVGAVAVANRTNIARVLMFDRPAAYVLGGVYRIPSSVVG